MPKLRHGSLHISSPAFEPGAPIPHEYTDDGENISPELVFSGIPEGTRELALVVHDPDAPATDGFTHWVLYGIPPNASGVPKRAGGTFTEGTNSAGSPGYTGPAPPPGHGQHHYFFHLYALDAPLDAAPGLTRDELLARIDDHIIEQARVVGVHQR
jgi:Raf kinase inhibitor-like YbhB/YbcL family protein